MTFDIACAGLALCFALFGLFRGLVRQVFGVIGFVGGLVAARLFAGQLGDLVAPQLQLSKPVAAAACAIAIFIVCEIAATLLGGLVRASLGAFTGAVDRLGGAALGLAKGVLVIWAVASLFGLLHRRAPEVEKRIPFLARLDLAHSRAVAASADVSALGPYEDQLKQAERRLRQRSQKAVRD